MMLYSHTEAFEPSFTTGRLGGTYWTTQMLTSHGVFGEFLLRIRREATSICHHYKEEEDTAQHTLEFCPA